MTYEVTITDGSGKAIIHRVELTRSADRNWQCKVDGKEFAFDSVQPEGDALSLLIGSASHEVRRDGNGSAFALLVGARRYEVEITDPRSLRGRKAKSGSADGPKKIVAPMPGKVVRILAAEGATVEAGQGVVVIEAMKMQNELKAPKAGKVQKMMAKEGAAVNAGDALAIIE
jgi:biotin carboxyl carrier protein